MLNIDKIRKQFPIYKKHEKLYFFDSAASSLKLKSVVKKMSDYYHFNGTNVYRGVYRLAYEATLQYDEARSTIAQFIHAKPEEIIFTKGTSHSLNMIARSLGDILKVGDEVITSEQEHHSSILPWVEICKKVGAKLKFIPLTTDGQITVENFRKVLTNQTKVVALTHISNVMGYITPIEKIVKLSHQKGAYVILDAAQSIAHLPINVAKMNVDFLAFSGHKMYGPNGIGVLYGKKALLDIIPPVEFGGEMVDKFSKEKVTWKEAPYKFETGTPPIAEAIGLKEAVKFLNKQALKKIHAHEVSLKNYILEKLVDEPGITIYNPKTQSGIINFNIDKVHPHDTASMLDQYGICVRAGHHCNQLMMQFLDVAATTRISLGIYNNQADCDQLVEAIKVTRDFFNNL